MSTEDIIRHPDEVMSDEERARQMWRVHPKDLDRLGFLPTGGVPGPRELFYLAHIKAAKRQKNTNDDGAGYMRRLGSALVAGTATDETEG